MEWSASRNGKKNVHKVGAGNVGAPATVSSFAPTDWKKQDDSDKPGQTGTLSGSHLGRTALRREQREQLESEHQENPSHGEEGETDRRHHKHSPQKRRNGSTPVGCIGRMT
jgi:hypothetical protein